MDIKAIAIEEAAKNKAKYGKAMSSVVFGMVMKRIRDSISKSDISKVKEIVNEAVKEVNESNVRINIIIKKKENEKGKLYDLDYLVARLKPLPNAQQGKVVTRIEPSPSGPLHLGHIFTLLLNYWYAKKYNGKFLLRIADTNPKNILRESYDMIVEDAEWLIQQSLGDVITQSERMNVYYEVAEYLIKDGFAYVCTCSQEVFKNYVAKGLACPHRDQSVSENLEKWQKMLNGEYDEGQAVLRIKTDIQHENPAVREWVAFRIIKQEHPLTRNEYIVWPTMNFSVAVDDHLNGITHVIRGKDHVVNTERQRYIYEYMNWNLPEFLHIGRINFEDLRLSTTQIKKDIAEGRYEGWEDVRLPFVRSFKKRGFNPKAFSIWVLQTGLTVRDKKTTYDEFMKNFIKIHRVIIDKEARRLFFIENKLKVEIKGLEKDIIVSIPYHPDIPNYGNRKFIITKNNAWVYIEKRDWDSIKIGEIFRLKQTLTLRKIANDKVEVINKDVKGKVIHYLPPMHYVDATIIMPDATEIKGIIESSIKDFPPTTVFQLERYGFVKLDKLYIDVKLYYIHK